MSGIILFGVVLMQVEHASSLGIRETVLCVVLYFAVLLSGYEVSTGGLPSNSQVFQCFIVAVSSGLIATVLFFFATDLVKDDPQN